MAMKAENRFEHSLLPIQNQTNDYKNNVL